MNVIFIYGPPASGKLTVATELAKQTGYRLFHNHLTRNIVQDIYPEKLGEHYDLVDELRTTIFAHCAKHKTDLIFTFVYDGPNDDAVVKTMIEAVTKNDGTVLFVELNPPANVLLERIGNASRVRHNKLIDRAVLQSILDTNPYVSLPYPDILTIDSSLQQPTETAKMITTHFNL